ncbi:MAG: cytochrome ubiquinol oxidase subunit II [Sulfuriferula multivorans]|uniref:Cytochrome ubiquinol oxidase subunit II n=1 Tax=Sulfuriferula multivorans TaxID=1559896 RepID=A0A7C9KYI0_9PROT|nr:cytochrome ubiquinol oxidase subunit II [Sulfuriferula multivorans]
MMTIGDPCGRMRRSKAATSGSSVCVSALMLAGCSGDTHLSFLDPQGPVASGQRWHFVESLAVLLVFVAIPVFVLTAWFLWRYRYGAKSSRYTPKWNYSALLEIASWAGPVVIVVLLGIIVWRATHALDPYKPLASDQPALRLQIIGYDWKWLFIYPDQGIASIGVLALPVGRPVAIQLTSATVMQSLHIPALGSQIYAMGGMVTQLHLQADRPGRSLGENNMYNGNGFHQQRFSAVAMTPERFSAWVDEVHLHGIALNDQSLKHISQRSTRAELIAALSQPGASDGNIYFKGATDALFSTVVKATKSGTPVAPASVRQEFANRAPLAARKPTESATDKVQ